MVETFRNRVTSLSDFQEKVLSVLPILPACLSILGSSTIIYLVIFMKQKEMASSVYKRLMVGMSLCDIIASIGNTMYAFIIPKETSKRIWASGNQSTCSIGGFVLQFSGSGILYNCMLSYYFLFVISFGMKKETIATRIEPFMHIISIGYPLTTAIYGAILGVYDETELGLQCWVTNFPKGCDLIPEVRCKSVILGYIFAGLPFFFVLVSMVVNNAIIYYNVRKTTNSHRMSSSTYSICITREQHPVNENSSTAIISQRQSNLQQQRHQEQEQQDSQSRRIRAVATQAFYYVGCFFITYICLVIIKLMDAYSYGPEHENQIFPLLVLNAIFVPMQGFFNLFVYIRQTYIRCRRRFDKESWFWAFRRVILGDSVVPNTNTMRRQRDVNVRNNIEGPPDDQGIIPVRPYPPSNPTEASHWSMGESAAAIVAIEQLAS